MRKYLERYRAMEYFPSWVQRDLDKLVRESPKEEASILICDYFSDSAEYDIEVTGSIPFDGTYAVRLSRVDNYDEIDLCFVVTYIHNICKTVCIYSIDNSKEPMFKIDLVYF